MLFSEKIKQLRISSGKLQKDLAKAIGVDVPAYSRYEHGERRPRREQVLRLARIFKTDPDELVAHRPRQDGRTCCDPAGRHAGG